MLLINEKKDLFETKSIAIVGVSQDRNKIGNVILQNVRNHGFEGKLFPVNPKYPEVEGLPCYPTLVAIPEEVDTVCIAIPAPIVKGAVLDAINKKVRQVVIISAGFGELGEAGRLLEEEIATLLNNAGILLLGPNCLGYINTMDNTDLSFAATFPKIGDIALFSQSGAICTALLDKAQQENMGFSHVVSMGNKAGVDESYFIPYFQKHGQVKVLGAYIESMKYGRAVIKEYTETIPKKPFVVIKPGKSDQSRQAIGSHTGAIAGSSQTFSTAMKQAGIVEAETLEDFSYLIKSFSWIKPFVGNSVAIVTNAGGPGILATDEAIRAGFSVVSPSLVQTQILASLLPPESSIKNPVDILGDARTDRFSQVIEHIENDDTYDVIVVIVTPQFVTEIEETVKALIERTKVSKKPIVPVFLGGERMQVAHDLCEAAEMATFTDLRYVMQTLATLRHFYATRDTPTFAPIEIGEKQVTLVEGIVDTETSVALLDQFSIIHADQQLCHTVEEALLWAESRYPIVLKVPNEILAHKTEMKGVFTNLKTNEALAAAWQTLTATVQSLTNKPLVLLVQKQISFEEELFIGGNRDGASSVYESNNEGFGHLLVFGKGGISTEIFKDFGYALVPAPQETLLNALASTKISSILVGFRNRPALAVGKFVQLLQKVQRLLVTYPEIVSIDFNPVLITETEVFAVDVKIFVQK